MNLADFRSRYLLTWARIGNPRWHLLHLMWFQQRKAVNLLLTPRCRSWDAFVSNRSQCKNSRWGWNLFVFTEYFDILTVCMLCKTNYIDEVSLGSLISCDDVLVHQYCLVSCESHSRSLENAWFIPSPFLNFKFSFIIVICRRIQRPQYPVWGENRDICRRYFRGGFQNLFACLCSISIIFSFLSQLILI